MRRCLVAIALLAASVTRAQEAAPAGCRHHFAVGIDALRIGDGVTDGHRHDALLAQGTPNLDADESRRRILEAVSRRYTAPTREDRDL